jgi:hypothetical protein
VRTTDNVTHRLNKVKSSKRTTTIKYHGQFNSQIRRSQTQQTNNDNQTAQKDTIDIPLESRQTHVVSETHRRIVRGGEAIVCLLPVETAGRCMLKQCVVPGRWCCFIASLHLCAIIMWGCCCLLTHAVMGDDAGRDGRPRTLVVGAFF